MESWWLERSHLICRTFLLPMRPLGQLGTFSRRTINSWRMEVRACGTLIFKRTFKCDFISRLVRLMHHLIPQYLFRLSPQSLERTDSMAHKLDRYSLFPLKNGIHHGATFFSSGAFERQQTSWHPEK